MTVGELIKMLEYRNQDAEVFVESESNQLEVKGITTDDYVLKELVILTTEKED